MGDYYHKNYSFVITIKKRKGRDTEIAQSNLLEYYKEEKFNYLFACIRYLDIIGSWEATLSAGDISYIIFSKKGKEIF